MFLFTILTAGAIVYMTAPAFYQSGFEVIYAGLIPAIVLLTLTGKLACHSLKSAKLSLHRVALRASPRKQPLNQRVSLKARSRAMSPAISTHLCPACFSLHELTTAPSAPWLRTHCSIQRRSLK